MLRFKNVPITYRRHLARIKRIVVKPITLQDVSKLIAFHMIDAQWKILMGDVAEAVYRISLIL